MMGTQIRRFLLLSASAAAVLAAQPAYAACNVEQTGLVSHSETDCASTSVVNGQISGLQGQITGAINTNNAQNGRLDTIEGVLVTQGNDIGVLRTDVNQLRTDVNTNTGDIGVLRTDVNTLRTDVNNHEGRIQQTETKNAEQDTKLADHETRITENKNKNTEQDQRLDKNDKTDKKQWFAITGLAHENHQQWKAIGGLAAWNQEQDMRLNAHEAILSQHSATLGAHSRRLDKHEKGLAIAMSMPDTWLSDKEKFAIAGNIGGFGDETALGFAMIGRIDQTWSLNMGFGTDTSGDEFGWKAGARAGW